MHGSRPRTLAALALLATFAFVLTADARHTDDGCAVEQHCIACRLHCGAIGAPVAVAAPVAFVQPSALLPVPRHDARLQEVKPQTPSRAPPLV